MAQVRRIQVSVDQGVNLKALKELQRRGLIVLLQVHDLEQPFRNVGKTGGAFTIGNSTIGGLDMLAGDDAVAVQGIIGTGHKADFYHLYAAALNHSQYFVTENPSEFIAHGKRKKLEALLRLKIMRTAEFLDEIEGLTQRRHEAG